MKKLLLFCWFIPISATVSPELLALINKLDSYTLIGALAATKITAEAKKELLDYASEQVEKRKKEVSITKSPDDRKTLFGSLFHMGTGCAMAYGSYSLYKYSKTVNRHGDKELYKFFSFFLGVESPILFLIGLYNFIPALFVPQAKKNLKKAKIIEELIQGIETEN